MRNITSIYFYYILFLRQILGIRLLLAGKKVTLIVESNYNKLQNSN